VQTTTIAPTHSGRDEVKEIVEAMSVEVDELARLLTDMMHERIAELEDDIYVWTLQSVRANLGLIVTLLREGTAPSSAQPPPEALAYAKEYVRRALPFELLGRAYRIGQATLSRYWLERLHARTADPDHLVDTFGFLSDWLFTWVETLEHHLTEFYMREREQWVRGAAAVRAAEVRALLEGARVDVHETSRRLVYNLDRHHVAFVVWSDEADRDADQGAAARFGEMERLAAGVAEALGAHAPLVVPQGHHLACWAGFHDPPALDALPATGDDAVGLRIALGTPGHGLDGFCLSHREALKARRVAKLSGAAAADCTVFADVAVDVLTTQDVGEASRFVARELGALATGDEAARRLTETLRAFLDEGASFVRAARRLGVHENTVAYRVRRAEELLGHRVSDRQLELRVALRLAKLLGSAAPPAAR
jgi:DNA-binding PucR family transcriptional regulator